MLLDLLPHRLGTSDDRVFSSDAKRDKVLTVAAVDDDGSQRPTVRRICEASADPLSRVVICSFVCVLLLFDCLFYYTRQASRPAQAGGNPNQNGRAEKEVAAANRRSCYCCGATW